MLFFIIFIVISITFYFVGIPILNKINEDKNVAIIEEFRKNGCTRYSDGCNSCSVYTNGSVLCTIMSCSKFSKAECYEYNKPMKPW